MRCILLKKVFTAIFQQIMQRGGGGAGGGAKLKKNPAATVPCKRTIYRMLEKVSGGGFRDRQKENKRRLILTEQKSGEMLLPIRNVFTARCELNIDPIRANLRFLKG
jgi:hypothetical protein